MPFLRQSEQFNAGFIPPVLGRTDPKLRPELTSMIWLTALLTLGLFAYLVFALIRPEKF
jgi:K+-transporting ATPase KdpF subunit